MQVQALHCHAQFEDDTLGNNGNIQLVKVVVEDATIRPWSYFCVPVMTYAGGNVQI